MESDNLLPNDGTYFGIPREPAEQTVERKKERAKTLEQVSVLKELVQHFEDQIAHLSSVDAMPDDCKKDPVKFMNLHNAHELARGIIMEEKEYIEGLLDNSGQTVL